MDEKDNLFNNNRDLLYKMVAEDSDSIHFLWNCITGQLVQFEKTLFPDNVSDPLEYIIDNGLIEPSYVPTFQVFSAQVENGIINGTKKSNFSIDVPMRFSPDDPYEYNHFFLLLLRDGNDRIVFIHFNIRPYNSKEALDKEILNGFSSDMAPKFFGQHIRCMMNKFSEKDIAFIQFDVERFKLINDNYGVDVGDEILKFFNDSLSSICTDDQPFCRLTADVFMIVIAFDDDEEIVRFIRHLESMLCGYKGIEYRLIFGVAIAEDKQLHTRKHGDNATLARKSIKGNALNNIGFYNGKLKTELYHRKSIEDDMENALLDNEFKMFLQPKHSISSGRIIGAEALARWIHPEKGMISPAEFIPVFEKNGFIVKLDQHIWECACKKIHEWIDKGIEPVPISVNISREYLHSFDVVGKLIDLVTKYNIPKRLLELEITETVDSESASDIVKAMKNAGFTMLMDDFGSGYSSLNMLKKTKFDVLKIDRSFLSEFMESERGRKIIAHTISMSHDIGLDIIAEGVETNEQAQFLKSCGCDSAQGFFYSRPVSESEFDKQLVEVNHL